MKTAYPRHRFGDERDAGERISGIDNEALAQAFDIDACMKVVLTPSGA